jgi:hypothetical protein
VQIVAILIGIVLLAGIVYYVSRPLVRQRGSLDVTAIVTLEVQRDSLYSQIRELDMDHATGKTNDDDYQRVRAELVAQAADILKRIDGAVAAAPVTPPAPADDVEALIAARRKSAAAPKPADDVEALIAARRKSAVTPKPAADEAEALIAARRKSTAPAVSSKDSDIEAQIAARRKSAPAAPVAELACPNCGKPVSADDAFCAKCGASLRARTASQA